MYNFSLGIKKIRVTYFGGVSTRVKNGFDILYVYTLNGEETDSFTTTLEIGKIVRHEWKYFRGTL